MSGFHPVLGLLAVAVCISYADGAPFSTVQKDDIIVNKLHRTDLHQSLPSAKGNGPLPSALYQKNKEMSKGDDDSQNTNVIDERIYENTNRGAIFAKLKDLRSRDKDAVPTNVDARKSDSGDIGEATQESEGILNSREPSASNEGSSSESEESGNAASNESNKSTLDSVLTASGSQEDCEEDGGSDSSTTSTLSSVSEGGTVEDTITPSPTSAPDDENGVTTSVDECEEEEDSGAGSDASSSESSASNSQIQESEESEECDVTEATIPTETPQQSTSTTTRRGKKPKTTAVTTQRSTSTTTTRRKKPNSEDSSGSFHASDSKGVEFSGSESLESTGQSTELSD